MKKYIFPSVYDYSDYMIRDVIEMQDINVVSLKLSYFQKILWRIRDTKIKFLGDLFSKILFKSLFRKWDFNNSICFVFDSNPFFMDIRFYKWLRKFNKNTILVAIVYNIIREQKTKIDILDEYYDKVFTFDLMDSKCFNYQHFWGIFSPIDYYDSSIEYDISFVGLDKGRFNTINNISKQLDKFGVRYSFNVIVDSNKITDKLSNVNVLKERLSYSSSIEIIKKSHCLLELVDETQTGLSLRTIEAIVFKKKLITNNKNLLLSPYYDKDNMIVLSDINQIPVNFLRQDYVDNNLNRDFSFKKIIDEISITGEQIWKK